LAYLAWKAPNFSDEMFRHSFLRTLSSPTKFKRANQNRSNLYFLSFGAGLLGVYYFSNLETVPGTNRRRFLPVTPQLEAILADNEYQQLMRQYQSRMLPRAHPITISVSNIAKKLITVSGLTHLDWEVHVIDSPIKNAFVIANGKIFVFTGILKVADTADKVAAVLGHEVVSVHVGSPCYCPTWCREALFCGTPFSSPCSHEFDI
jgi:hypothetical protein